MKKWDLSEVAFSRLLARLNADPELAGKEYENLRQRLIYYFERKGCRTPAELSDETINRIARKIEEGQQIRDMLRYSSTVARLVMLEHWDDPKREWEEVDERLTAPEDLDRDFDEHKLNCMRRCMKSLSRHNRKLIIKNVTSDKNGKLEIAHNEGITINALRLKVFRIRAKLNECYQECICGSSKEKADGQHKQKRS